jgi:hypothetical protein
VRRWTFDPALRGGRAVAARIRMEVAFEPPTPVESPPDAPVPKPPDAPVATPAVEEVTVHGQRVAPGATSMGRAEVRQLPGAFGDPFRAIEALPGVTPIVSGLPFFYVRGAPPGNVGYFLDGACRTFSTLAPAPRSFIPGWSKASNCTQAYDFDEDGGAIHQGKPIVISTFGDYVYEVLIPSIPRFRGVGMCSINVGGHRGLGDGG